MTKEADKFLKLDGLVNDKMVNELIEENSLIYEVELKTTQPTTYKQQFRKSDFPMYRKLDFYNSKWFYKIYICSQRQEPRAMLLKVSHDKTSYNPIELSEVGVTSALATDHIIIKDTDWKDQLDLFKNYINNIK